MEIAVREPDLIKVQVKHKVSKAMFIDVDYSVKDDVTFVRLLLKGKKGLFRLYDVYAPYFYIDAPESAIPAIKSVSVDDRGQTAKVTNVEPVTKTLYGKEKKLLKVYCKHPFQVPAISKALEQFKAYEHRIPFARRYIIDKGLVPFSIVSYERDGKVLAKIVKVDTEAKALPLNTLAFDIETYNQKGIPRPESDPSIMISYCIGKESGVLTYKKTGREYATELPTEKDIIERFCKILKEKDVELLLGYNSAVFDLPYLETRAKKVGAQFSLGRDKQSFKRIERGMQVAARITGRVHIDLYPVIRFLGMIGALKVSKFTLENAYEEITGKKKHMVNRMNIWEMWDSETDRPALAEYSLHDAEVTKELGDIVLPTEIQMSKITKTPLFEVCGATAGQLVESLLMNESYRTNAVIPNRPNDQEVKAREANPIEGAFVKLPIPGIYENLVVFDFRGLYPSIICSHNIDPYTLNCDCCTKEESFTSPMGHRFCKKKRGLIPQVLDMLVTTRSALKAELKKYSPDSEEYTNTFAKSQALKILANSYYGYLAYARSRWYSREAAESVTAWGRHYIQETMKKAEDLGFTVLYGDTDSVMLLRGEKSKEEAVAFMKNVNSSLPGNMELELEAFYPRGLFVTKKGAEGGRGAKKKYALIGEDGRIKIRGFELVRRDWSAVAKDTQKAVLNAVLKDGSKEKAVKIVRDMVERLKSGKVPLEELVIYSQIRKEVEKYDIISPELAAAKKANERGTGVKYEAGSTVAYVITRSGRTVSEKAEVIDFAKDYDANYYIEHQVLPSVLKILKELGYSEDDLKFKGSQSGLSSFM